MVTVDCRMTWESTEIPVSRVGRWSLYSEERVVLRDLRVVRCCSVVLNRVVGFSLVS